MGRRSGEPLLAPRLWASRRPFGIGAGRPNTYGDMWRALRENTDNLPYAWRILTQGTCDGCALGTKGMRDWTTDEVHLCNVRLGLLRLNTMPGLPEGVLDDVAALAGRRDRDLRELGRLTHPMVRRAGDAGFTRLSWSAALDLVADRMRATTPDRLAFYLTSRGTPNETYYAAAKATRAIGTSNVDNAARICHAPSGVALKQMIGVAATTCSYSDWIGSDLVLFAGSNVANNQPVSMKYLFHAKKQGTAVVCVNTYREPGMERYWVPSNTESTVFGTRIADRFHLVDVGGDVAFFTGVLRHIVENGWYDAEWVAAHTTGFDDVVDAVTAQRWTDLERVSGTTREEMRELAERIRDARTGVLVWSMGLTQHRNGEDNVRALVNIGLSQGWVGRDRCGLMPIRGHSGVQGGAEMGAYSGTLPGNVAATPEAAADLARRWGFTVPHGAGMTAPQMVDAALDGRLDVLWTSGGNFLRTLSDPATTRAALERVPLRVHVDICLSDQMLVDPADTVLVLPAMTRYEVPGGVTETSTERRIILSPAVEGPRVGEARPEWDVFLDLARRVRPDLADRLAASSTADLRREIADVVPAYAGIERLSTFGDSVQYGGPHLAPGGRFPTPDGRARFVAVPLPLPEPALPIGSFRVATRRGKQFNSMVQADRDPITGARRDDVLAHAADLAAVGLADGDRVVVRSAHGVMVGRARAAPVAKGTLQVHWPEGAPLLDARARSPESGVPDYNTVATLEAAPGVSPSGG